MPYFFTEPSLSTPFLRKQKNDTKYRWMATRQKPYRYLMSLFLFTFLRKKRVRNRPPPRFAKIVLCLFEIIDQKLRLIPGTFF